MRKRIVIAACAVVAIGALAFVLSQPKKESLEWHKKEYRDTRMLLAGHKGRLSDLILFVRSRVTGRASPRFTESERQALIDKVARHEQALVEMGFLVMCRVPFRGRLPILAELRSEQAMEQHVRAYLDMDIDETGTNMSSAIVLLGPSNNLPKWKAYVDSVAVREIGK